MTGLGHGWHGGVLIMLQRLASVYVSIHTYFIVIIGQDFICCREHKMNDFLYSSGMDGLSVI